MGGVSSSGWLLPAPLCLSVFAAPVLQVMDGMECTRLIRERQRPDAIRPFIIAQTANARSDFDRDGPGRSLGSPLAEQLDFCPPV